MKSEVRASDPIGAADGSDSIELDFDKARDRYRTQREDNKAILVPANVDLVLIGRLPGDGTGLNKSYFTDIGEVKEFVLYENKLFLLASCCFRGPYTTGLPQGRAHYFRAPLRHLVPGTYTAIVRITPEGKVYQEHKNDKEIELPDFGILTCEFEVAERKEKSEGQIPK
ncbi:MAG: hypothetical protein JWM11_7900 [Planctomycetaceae bacterium]|nr:hypothetical protein [Planctomycetaceae bacterium]